jgi:hypothetical protein
MQRKSLALLLMAVLTAQASFAARTGWKRYRNERWGFCLAYPSNWETDEGVNKAGIGIYPPQNRPDGLLSQLSIGALPNARSRNEAFPTLEENFNGVQDVLRSEGATEMTILEKRNADFLQKPALFTKIRYKEAVSGIIWIEERINFKTQDEILYSMELKARPEEFSELEPIFNVMVYNTFRMNCVSHSRKGRK